MGIKDFLKSGVDKIRSGIVSGAKVVRDNAGKIKDAALGRNKALQGNVDKCVRELNILANGEFAWEGQFLQGVRNAFALIFSDEFVDMVDRKKKKGFDGFVDYVVNLLGEKFKWNEEWPEGAGDKFLKILKNVKKFKAPRSRVNALIAPCEKLYKKYISETKKNEKLEGKIESYFDAVCEYLRKASKAESRDEFESLVSEAFDNMKRVAVFESKEDSKTFGKWYRNFEGRSNFSGKLQAILSIDTAGYQGNGGFWKWLRKGGTKMQKLSKLVASVGKKSAELNTNTKL